MVVDGNDFRYHCFGYRWVSAVDLTLSVVGQFQLFIVHVMCHIIFIGRLAASAVAMAAAAGIVAVYIGEYSIMK